MNSIKSSAPGKVILSGEYAVLDGAPAVSMAVNRRAVITLAAADDLSIQSIGLAGDKDTRIFECACDALAIHRWRGTVLLDTRAFADSTSGIKFGIGSSAALTVGLVCALAASARGEISGLELFRCSQKAHHAFQQGVGSGVDVATSIVGGLVEYCVGETPRSLAWPDGLHYQLLWSGVPANTSEKLRRLPDSKTRGSNGALSEVAANVAEAWISGDAAAIVGEYRDYVPVLRQFDIDHGLGIFDAGHDALAEKKMSANIVYKPCGAGGGDIGIVLGTEKQAVKAFAHKVGDFGFRQLDMTIDDIGVVLNGAGA
ncbi:MAG: hypothetical protein OER97_00860 [Gammaproteobacteria bacterium]|nr:hypothetical protein [Gammaproteobacteria bacterium]